MKKRILSLCMALVLCLGLLPATALAAENAPATLIVGGTDVIGGGYWTTNSTTGELTQSSESESWNVHYDTSNNTLTLKNAVITGKSSDSAQYNTVGIYAYRSSGDVSLKIELQGENTITSDGYGIYVSSNSNGSASLTISGEEDGNLTASGVGGPGIQVLSSSGDAALTIQNTDVTAEGGDYANGVTVQAGSANNQKHTATLTVNGGKLTAIGDAGIEFNAGGDYNGITTTLSVSNNALVDTRDSRIVVSGNNTGTGGLTPTGDGIVFNGNAGTVYGNVTLHENLTIGEGESLTLDDGASLDTNGHNVIVDGGTIDDSIKDSLGDSVKYTPTIATSSLPNGTVGTEYSTTLAADGTTPITWSVDSDSLPAGLSLNESTGEISGTPAAAGKYTFDVEAENDYGSETRQLTIGIKAAPTGAVSVSVTPDAIRLPSVMEGYEPQEPKYITIKNTGDQTIQLKEYGKDPWLVITLDKTTLKPDEEATMTIKLKDGLSAETRSTLKAFLSYIGEDGTKGQAHFKITYEVKHDMDRIDAKEPTHLEDGNIEYWYCAYCKKYYADGAGANELKLEEIIIPKLKDHTVDGTGWHSDETNHWNTCACGEKLNKTAHTFMWVIDKKATASEAGSKHEECTVCGYAKTAVEIPATGASGSSGTGDDSNIILWIMLMAVSAVGAVGAVICARKKDTVKEDSNNSDK